MKDTGTSRAMRRYRRPVARRLALVLTGALLVLTRPAVAAEGDAPTLSTPTFTPDSAISVDITVEVAPHNVETQVYVEYVTAGAYRRVPGAATTVHIATANGPEGSTVAVTGHVGGLEPGSTYRMRVKASNTGGETLGSDVIVKTPAAPKTAFKAKVGKTTTKLTKLVVSGLLGTGGETVQLTCRTASKGCPFRTKTIANLVEGTLILTPEIKRSPLRPGAKVAVIVSSDGRRLSTLTLKIREDQQPKVKRS